MIENAPLSFLNPAELYDGDLQLRLIRFAAHSVHRTPACFFQMIHAESKEELGNINLRIGSTRHLEYYAGHVGYQVHPAHQGHHYASRALHLLLPFAARLGLDPLWITCDPDNAASRRTLERIGAHLIEVVEVPEDCIIRQSGHPRKCRYRLETALLPHGSA